jgi:hypothetical protein
MPTQLKERGTTVLAILMVLILTTVFGLMAIDSLLGAIYPERLSPSFGIFFGSAPRAGASTAARGGPASNASGMIGIAMGSVVVVSSIVVVGLLFARAWAREAALVIYGMLGLVVLAASFGGLAGDPPAPSAWTGVLVGITNLVIVGLLLTKSSARIFSGRPLDRSLDGV